MNRASQLSPGRGRRIEINLHRESDALDRQTRGSSPYHQKVEHRRLQEENEYLIDEKDYLKRRIDKLEEMVSSVNLASGYRASQV